MYDLCKNNQRVAKLQLTKVAHRLGEPILGILDFGDASVSTCKVKETKESTQKLTMFHRYQSFWKAKKSSIQASLFAKHNISRGFRENVTQNSIPSV